MVATRVIPSRSRKTAGGLHGRSAQYEENALMSKKQLITIIMLCLVLCLAIAMAADVADAQDKKDKKEKDPKAPKKWQMALGIASVIVMIGVVKWL